MKKIIMAVLPSPKEPTAAQAESGNYAKRKFRWNGLTIAIENEAGSMRRGVSRTGVAWEKRMLFAYGYIRGTMGVDGDQVDVYIGPNLDSPLVYVVHQRQYGNWTEYDEDKCMLGFDSEEDAKAAFLSCYDDPRFLGPITTMPVAEFVEKVRATKEAPNMVKAIFVRKEETLATPLPVLFLAKSFVAPHTRHVQGRTVLVSGYQTRRTAAAPKPDSGQLDIFADTPVPKARAKKFYVTMIRDPGPRQKVARLAGPFDTHEEALKLVSRAREEAEKVDPRAVFDAFGTSGVESDNHRPGVLNSRLGVDAAEKSNARDSLLADFPDGYSLKNGKGLAKDKWGVFDEKGKLYWQYADTKEEAVRLAKQHKSNTEYEKERKDERSLRVDSFRSRMLAGEEPTDADLKLLDLKPSAEFPYISPVIQEVFGISKQKVREAMGDSLRKWQTDMGTDRWSANAKRALKNAAQYAIKNSTIGDVVAPATEIEKFHPVADLASHLAGHKNRDSSTLGDLTTALGQAVSKDWRHQQEVNAPAMAHAFRHYFVDGASVSLKLADLIKKYPKMKLGQKIVGPEALRLISDYATHDYYEPSERTLAGMIEDSKPRLKSAKKKT